MNKEVRFFKRSEKAVLLDAIDRLWAHNHIYVRNPAVLEHFVWDTPYREELTGKDNYSFVGMWVNGEIVGLKGVIPQEVNIFGEIAKSQTGTVWIVKKRKGVSINGFDMNAYIEQIRMPQIEIALGISKVNVKLKRKLGAYVLDDIPRWIAVNRLDETAQTLLTDSSLRVCLPVLRDVQMDDAYQIEIDDLDKTTWDEFYFKCVAPRTIGTCRDFKFLHWRYVKSPVLKYHFLAVRDREGGYLGLAVIRIESILDGKYTIGRILEFISFDLKASIILANAVILYDREVLIWDFYCLSDVTAFGLEAVGFRKLPEWNQRTMLPTRFHPIDYSGLKINVSICVNNGIKQKLNPLNPLSQYQWYITKGDADQDRAN